MSELHQNRGQTGEGCSGGKHQNSDRAFIIDRGSAADLGNRPLRHDQKYQRDIERYAGVPPEDDPRRHAPGQCQQTQGNCGAESEGQEQPGMKVPQSWEEFQFSRLIMTRH